MNVQTEYKKEQTPPSIGMKDDWRVVCDPGISSAEVGLAHQQTLADELLNSSTAPALMIWRCQRALLVTRSETRLPYFNNAVAAMQAAGWPVLLRKSGGGVCPVGPGAVQISIIEAVFTGATMNAKYAALTKLIQTTLEFFQIVSQTGPVDGAYCSGNYDLAVQGKKIAGMSQHWFRNRCGIHCVVTAASINIEEPPEVLAGVVNKFNDGAGSSLRCQSAALTNMRLCEGAAHHADQNLALAVMNQLGSHAFNMMRP